MTTSIIALLSAAAFNFLYIMISNFYGYFAEEIKYAAKSDFIPVLKMITHKYLASRVGNKPIPMCVDPVSLSYWYSVNRSAKVEALGDFQSMLEEIVSLSADEKNSPQLLAKLQSNGSLIHSVHLREEKLKFWDFKRKATLHKLAKRANEDVTFEDALKLVYWLFLRKNAGSKSEFKELVLTVVKDEYRPLC